MDCQQTSCELVDVNYSRLLYNHSADHRKKNWQKYNFFASSQIADKLAHSLTWKC